MAYVPEKVTVADCLRKLAYPASKNMTDVSAPGDEAETAEAKKIIDMEHMIEDDGVQCFVVMAADASLKGRVSRAVHVLVPGVASSTSTSSLSRASKTAGSTTTQSLRP